MSDIVTGNAQRPGLIIRGGSALLQLSWKLFMLPIFITGSVLRLITGSVMLFYWLVGSVLSYSLTMIGLTNSGRHPESPPSPPDRVSVSAVSEATDSSSEYENRRNIVSESMKAWEAIDFVTEFEMQYGDLHPNFVPESFTDAVQRSRREMKLLFVYLHALDHPDTQLFCKETLCSETLSGFVNENFVAWGYSVSANGGLKMSKKLKKFSCRFPFCAVIMASTGQSIYLIRQFEGHVSPEKMLAELQTVLDESTAALVAARLDPGEQDAAYRSAPGADQAREDRNQLEKEAKSGTLCVEKVLSMGPEPEKGPDVTQVLVRLPNGERKGRRFHCNATLQSVYDFVDSSGCLEVGSYTLVTFFPRVLYGEEELSSTLQELGLYPHASLFVELKT